jgi:hypothetical protein
MAKAQLDLDPARLIFVDERLHQDGAPLRAGS